MNEDRQTAEVQNETIRQDDAIARRQTVARTNMADSATIASRVVRYIAGFIISLLGLRVIMFLLGANQGVPFVDFLYAISAPFAMPFYGIFPEPAYGRFALDTASLVGMLIYALIAAGIAKLLTLTRAR